MSLVALTQGSTSAKRGSEEEEPISIMGAAVSAGALEEGSLVQTLQATSSFPVLILSCAQYFIYFCTNPLPLYPLFVSKQCHACSCNWRQPASEEEEVPTCPQCGGEFVERISLGVAARPPPVAISSELLRQVSKLS